MQLTNNKILITGGATGIGFGLAEQFVKEGNTVIICGRREAALMEAKEKCPSLITKQCDLTVSAERESLFNWIATNHADLNVLINNAGIQQWLNVTSDDFFSNAQKEIITNIEAPIHLVSLFTKLKSLNTIMNVTSGLSFVPIATMSVYCATKAFFHSFTLSLRHSLKANNIEVIEIIPPALNTDLGGKGKHDYAPPVSDFITAIFEQLRQGKNELTFGMSENMIKASVEDMKIAFERMNNRD